MTDKISYKYFKTSLGIIQLAVMYYVRCPLSYRQVEDILSERGVDICHETIRFWVNRFGGAFAKKIGKKRRCRHSFDWMKEQPSTCNQAYLAQNFILNIFRLYSYA
jgi:putative transposase